MRKGITLERQGQRVYFLGDTFAAKDRIKGLGGHWDGDRRAWWVGAKKAAAAEALVASLAERPASAETAASVGLAPDAPAGVVADALEEAGRGAEAAAARKGPQRPAAEVRLTGKGEYQGRSYYLGPQTRDGARVLILGLPRADGSYYERWVPAAEVRVTKTYQPREVWDGRRYSGRTRTAYQTLGAIADFIEGQREARASGAPLCSECGKAGELVADLEDGQLKHRGCCDIPPG